MLYRAVRRAARVGFFLVWCESGSIFRVYFFCVEAELFYVGGAAKGAWNFYAAKAFSAALRHIAPTPTKSKCLRSSIKRGSHTPAWLYV